MDGVLSTAQRVDAEIERYDALDPDAPGLQALVDLVTRVCGVPYAAVNILTSTEQHQVVASGMDGGVCRREDSMCASVQQVARPVVVGDASQDPRFADNPFVTGEIDAVRFYASAPITTPDGVTIGRMCVFDTEPRELDEQQVQALRTLADQVMEMLELRLRTRLLEQSLRELTAVRDDLRRSNEHLGLFAAQVSHDLRNPLTAIQTNAELLATEPAVVDDPDARTVVDGILAAATRMDQMIGEVLGVARDGGRLRVGEAPLADVFESARADVATLLRRTGGTIEVGDLPVVRGDAGMLYVVALNLLSNALKFGRPGVPPRVRVSAERRDGSLRIRVTDNGVGVPPERREALFGLYERGTTDVEGHGIGLTTALRLVQAHRGTIGLDTPDGGVGLTVWFDLPA
ncbi:GAF domain-containing sensor histidine kinase [Aeromicrobium massiliense]|uniref:GAF domain-containing sensor histidine kinase n=1 Tax=Aeromicrobium massiliense TaxID=1464554 RepID=UPI0002EED558|nr:GAF domain-containing sensor histidine kinase [Aeromicrobium massiliense]